MRGLLQQADGGTLFLDEIGDMPLGLQTRLLRVLAEGEVAPLGAARRQAVDIQVICATHRDLAALAAGGFREDLYFRLGGARFELPLRERSDRLALIRRILDEETAHCGVRIELGEAALECLLGYRWPGNVRQLRHVALRLRAVRRRHPATRRPSGRAAWRRPDTGQCVRERRRSGARRPARRPRAASLETHGRGAGTGYLASDPVSAGAPAWHPHAGPGGRLRCAGGRRSRQARKIKTSLEPCPVNAGGLSL